MSLPISDRQRPAAPASSKSGTTSPKVVPIRPAAEVSRTRATAPARETSSVSSEARDAAGSERSTRLSVAGERSRQAIGETSAPAETHAVGIDEADPSDAGGGTEEGKDGGLGGVLAGGLGGGKVNPQQAIIDEALESGETGTFTNGNGDEVEFQVNQGESTDSHDVYTVTVGGDEVTVNIPPGENANDVLARITDYYTQQPENVRGAVDTINIEPGRNPSDEYWAEEYDSPGFTSAATGGDGTITFWNGSQYVQEGIFEHEFGHNVGSAVRDEQNAETGGLAGLFLPIIDSVTGDDQSQNVPRGYSQAAEGDNNSVSDYGDNAIAEDFAETYQAYCDAVEGGPKAVRAFQMQYPERYALIVDQVLSRDLDAAA